MNLHGAYLIGAVVMGMVIALLGILAVVSLLSERPWYCEDESLRVRLEERKALRILRARYARGEISEAEFRRLRYELEE